MDSRRPAEKFSGPFANSEPAPAAKSAPDAPRAAARASANAGPSFGDLRADRVLAPLMGVGPYVVPVLDLMLGLATAILAGWIGAKVLGAPFLVGLAGFGVAMPLMLASVRRIDDPRDVRGPLTREERRSRRLFLRAYSLVLLIFVVVTYGAFVVDALGGGAEWGAVIGAVLVAGILLQSAMPGLGEIPGCGAAIYVVIGVVGAIAGGAVVGHNLLAQPILGAVVVAVFAGILGMALRR